jgi:hypothetical protein
MPDYDGEDSETIADAVQEQGGNEPTPIAASVALGGATSASVAALVQKQVG